MAASDTISGIGGAISGGASMIPGIGTGIGAGVGLVTSLISGIVKSDEAKKQALRAENLRRQSAITQKMALRPEYMKSLKMNEMAALYGLPELNKYTENIDQDVANNARAIVESSPDGGVALNAINATLAKSYQAKNDLYQKDSLMKDQKMAKVADQMWNTGDKQMDLVGLQRQDKAALNQGAMNLENSATANKVGSIDQILSTVGAFGNTIGKIGMNSGSNATSALTTSGKTDETGVGTSTLDPNIVATLMALKKSNPELFSGTDANGFWNKQSTFQTPSFQVK